MKYFEVHMFSYKRVIRVQDTDATGVIYFANLLQMGLEAFEEFMRVQDFSFQKMIESKELLMPIVHAEADFFAPLTVGDEVDIRLSIKQIGTTSFTHSSEFFLNGERTGVSSIVHVAFSPKEKEAIPLPKFLVKALSVN